MRLSQSQKVVSPTALLSRHSLAPTNKVSPTASIESNSLIDPFCGVRIWCSGKYRYRFIFGETVLKEFTVNFVPKKSNIKVKLTSDKEQAWGTVHTLKATITPKVSLTCTVERDNENIGVLKVKNGAGSMKFTALAREKPVSGRSVVSLYTVCNSGKYYGASEFSFALFVP